METIKISKQLSVGLTHLNAFLTFLVVLIHYSASFRPYLPDNKIFEYSFFYFSQVLSRVAVPCFFVISGILAFWKVSSVSDAKSLIRKRLYSLGVPYLIWNLIGFIYISLPLFYTSGFQDWSIFNPISIIVSIFKSDYLVPLWYIRNLLFFTCLAPLIYIALRNRYSIFFVLAITVVLNFLPNNLFLELFTGLFFYVLGALLALYCKSYINQNHNINVYWIICATFFLALQVYRLYMYDSNIGYVEQRDPLFEFVCPLLFLFLLTPIRSCNISVKWYEKHTFIIYAGHYFVVSIMASNLFCSLFHFPGISIWYNTLVLIIEPFIIYLGLSCFGGALSRYCPKNYKILTGGR